MQHALKAVHLGKRDFKLQASYEKAILFNYVQYYGTVVCQGIL